MPYVADKKYAAQTEAVGNGQCISLVKALTGAPASSLWKEGDKVADIFRKGKIIPEGTAIATFENGRYPNHPHGNHAAIFVRSVPLGFEVFDQWAGAKPAKRTIRFGMPKGTSAGRMGEHYSVVL